MIMYGTNEIEEKPDEWFADYLTEEAIQMICDNDRVSNVERVGDTLHVTTEFITLVDEEETGDSYDVGHATIMLSLEVNLTKESPSFSISCDNTHPHVNGGSLCMGDYWYLYEDMLNARQIPAMIGIIIQSLYQFNAEDCFQNPFYPECPNCGESGSALSNCDYCGRQRCSGCMYTCANCDEMFCDNCGGYCEHCESSLCRECLYYCTKCDQIVCDSCSASCAECNSRFCWEDDNYHGTECPKCGDLFCEGCLDAHIEKKHPELIEVEEEEKTDDKTQSS